MLEKKKYLSVIIPVYNEEDSIVLLHEQLSRVLEVQNFSYEIIYVDDGSVDSTYQALRRLAIYDSHVCIVRLSRNFGQTAALSAGIEHSEGAILIFMDGDLQNDPLDIPRLLAKLDEGYDVVSGWRKQRQDARFSRKLPSWCANRLITKVTGLQLHDFGCTLKAYRREIFEQVRLYGEMHRFIPAYAALAGAAVTEIEVKHHARQFGHSKYGISRTVRVLLDLCTLKFLGSFATKPGYAFGIPGLCALLFGLGCGLWPLSRRFVARRSSHQSRIPEVALAVQFTGFGLLSLMLGLLAELLMRTYHESQNRPTYVVRELLSASTQPLEDQEFTATHLMAVGQ